jgi:RimJ/RimL family protein N-acetyltransferase
LSPPVVGSAVTGTPFLYGDRVTLRTIEEDDLAWLQRTTNDPRVWVGALRPEPHNREQTREYYEEELADDETVTLLVEADGDRVGFVGMHDHSPEAATAELGYWYAHEAWGNGYATGAARRLVAYGFEQRNLHKWTAKTAGNNEASMRVLEKVGFTEEGVHRSEWFIDGKYRDVHWFGLLESEWEGTDD